MMKLGIHRDGASGATDFKTSHILLVHQKSYVDVVELTR